MENENSMGSLAQAARGNQLKSARIIMIIVGVLSVAVNAGMFYLADQQIDKEIQDLAAQGMAVEQSAVDAVRMQNTIIIGSGALLGIVFIVLGIMVYTFPVPCTIAGLVLYVGSAVVFGLLDPTTIARGIILKVFITLGLFKSVQSAFAYEAEKKSAMLQRPTPE